MIWTFKIELLFGAYAEDSWSADLEIDSSSTLEDLHIAIQDAVEFDDDHLYEFYIAKTENSHGPDVTRFDDENEGLYDNTLEDIYPLAKDMKLFYMFDYGDSWLFKLTKSTKAPQEAKLNIDYPRILNEVGKKPEQYPNWDEDMEEYEMDDD